MPIFYDFIFLLISLFYLPGYLFKKKFHRGFLMRLGFLPSFKEPLERPIWIHAVSVGEAVSIKPLIEALRIAYPEKRFVLSTVTSTGNKIMHAIARGKDCVIYLPLDFSFIVRGVVDRLEPCLFINVETEIWPNLISYLAKKRIPTITVNGRISDRSFKGYSAVRTLIKPVLEKITLLCMQSSQDYERLLRLGISKSQIHVTGNVKFDLCNLTGKDSRYREKMNLAPRQKLLVAGSTHPGEEEIILSIYKKLLNDYPELRLLLAPRHPERSSDVERIVSSFGFTAVMMSEQRFPKESLPESVFILNTIGELPSLYAASDIVFMGGSLVRKGGHNILEPAFYARPIIFGRHMFNFSDIVGLFLRNKAAISVENQQGLEDTLRHLLREEEFRTRMGQSAKKLVLENQGATSRNLRCILGLLRP